MRLAHDRARQIARADEAAREPRGLRELRRRRRERQREARERAGRRLLDERDDPRARRARGGERGDQKRAAARDHDTLAAHRRAALDERLQAARARHAGQRPAGKRQQQLARAAAQNQLPVAEHERALLVLDEQRAGPRRGDDACSRQMAHVRLPQHAEARARERAGRGVRPVSPHLSAGARVVVDDRDRAAAARRRARGGEARRPRADDRDVDRQNLVRHRVRSTCMPSRQSVWHASLRRPSIVTLHSWHTPIPQKGARAAPVHDVRAVSSPASASAAATVVPSTTSSARRSR
ncbi:hypothetical protein BMAPRL20_1453 [Burkholderia mallei PRL-20]|nr:hypothetical protein BMAPRL20_1453 [Burkholderia mallei PRL-20]